MNTDSKEIFDSMINENVHISYTGPFDSQILTVIAKNIEVSLSQDPRLNKKIFKIFIELAQNISYYSAEQILASEGVKSGVGTFTIQEYEDYFMLATGNMATQKDLMPVVEKCNVINHSDRDQLREFKRLQRNLPPSARGGGNIGLIQVALTADNPVEFKVIPISENESFFILAVKVNKVISDSE